MWLLSSTSSSRPDSMTSRLFRLTVRTLRLLHRHHCFTARLQLPCFQHLSSFLTLPRAAAAVAVLRRHCGQRQKGRRHALLGGQGLRIRCEQPGTAARHELGGVCRHDGGWSRAAVSFAMRKARSPEHDAGSGDSCSCWSAAWCAGGVRYRRWRRIGENGATQRARDASSVEVQRMSDVLCRRSSSRLAFLVCRTASTASVYCFSCVHVESRCRRVGRRGTPDG